MDGEKEELPGRQAGRLCASSRKEMGVASVATPAPDKGGRKQQAIERLLALALSANGARKAAALFFLCSAFQYTGTCEQV